MKKSVPTIPVGLHWLTILLVFAGLLCSGRSLCAAGERAEAAKTADETIETRCIVLELYVRNEHPACPQFAERLHKFAKEIRGLEIRVFDLDQPGKHVDKFQQILRYFRLENAGVPAVYGCNYFLSDLNPNPELEQRVKSLLTVEVFVRSGCPKCAKAEAYLAKLKPRYPALQFRVRDLISDVEARDRVHQLAERYRKQAASVPVFYFCNQLLIGFTSEESTGRQLESKLDEWSIRCPPEQLQNQAGVQLPSTHEQARSDYVLSQVVQTSRSAGLLTFAAFPNDNSRSKPREPVQHQPDAQPLGQLSNKGPVDDPIPDGTQLAPLPQIPDESAGTPPVGTPSVDGNERPPPAASSDDSIEVPLLGTLSESRLGMPAFTFLIGLVDGFNPCAMWVLLFLLSVLVNLRSRAKILAVAGTFVAVSGLAYFAFMAAWLNVFLLVGYLRWAQISLGLLAVAIGSVHVKDFFAFKKGFSLSIPESAKPGIYDRVRKLVTAENLSGAIAGAFVLAVLVNIIELLCTAGLPAMYTEILTMQGYAGWKNYAYLGLYNIAYMFDDMLMVACVVITLSRHKLQERGGRWLKLVSGVAILALGLLMIFKPELLV